MFNNNHLGTSVIEILVAIGIFVIISTAALSAMIGATNLGRLTKEQLQATQLAQQGFEATVSIKNNDWNSLVVGSHGLNLVNNSWIFTGTSDLDPTSKFTRTIVIDQVNRDSNHIIITSGGTLDPETKKITVNVSWQPSPTRNNNVTYTSYLTHWQFTKEDIEIITTPQPTPTPSSCQQVCLYNSYTAGTCRANNGACNVNGETRVSAGDVFCTGGQNVDTCCCAP